MFIEFRKIIGVSEEVSECTGAGIEFQRAHHVKVNKGGMVRNGHNDLVRRSPSHVPRRTTGTTRRRDP